MQTAPPSRKRDLMDDPSRSNPVFSSFAILFGKFSSTRPVKTDANQDEAGGKNGETDDCGRYVPGCGKSKLNRAIRRLRARLRFHVWARRPRQVGFASISAPARRRGGHIKPIPIAAGSKMMGFRERAQGHHHGGCFYDCLRREASTIE